MRAAGLAEHHGGPGRCVGVRGADGLSHCGPGQQRSTVAQQRTPVQLSGVVLLA